MPKAFRARHRLLFERWTIAIETGILAFSDTQLVTSLAILISGYLQISCGLSFYHWQTIVNLAWYSALTHLATLTSLRKYFRSRPFMATCRAILMGMLVILLSTAFVPTGYLVQIDLGKYASSITGQAHNYTKLVSSPARCFWMPKSRDDLLDQVRIPDPDHDFEPFNFHFNTPIIVLSLSYLTTSYLIRVVRISAPLSRFFGFWLESLPMVYLQNRYQMTKHGPRLQNHRIMRRFITALLLLIITLAEAFYEAGDSMIWEILWLSAALVWGTLRLVGLRIQMDVPDENLWGFGQILPLLLSILPIWCLLSTSCCSGQILSAESAFCCKNQDTTCSSTLRRIKRTTWFRILTILIIGTAAILAAYLLFDLPATVIHGSAFFAGIDSLQKGALLGMMVQKYVLALAFSATTLIIFVWVCLVVRWRMNHARKNSPIGGRGPRIPNICGQRSIQNAFWLLVAFSVLALQVAFIITMLIYPAWLILAFYPGIGEGIPVPAIF